MGQAPVSVLDTQTPKPLPNDRTLRWAELGLVCVVAFAQPLLKSIFILKNGLPQHYGAREWNFAWIAGFVNEAASLLLLIYVLKRSNRSTRALGFSFSLRDLGVGVLLFVGATLAYGVGASVLQAGYHFWYGTAAPVLDSRRVFGDGAVPLMIPYVLLTPFFEELIVRAYLTTELSALTGSVVLASTVSVVLQTSYHLYYGIIGALSVGCVFVVFAVYYARTRRAFPIIVAHALMDIVATAGLFTRAH